MTVSLDPEQQHLFYSNLSILSLVSLYVSSIIFLLFVATAFDSLFPSGTPESKPMIECRHSLLTGLNPNLPEYQVLQSRAAAFVHCRAFRHSTCCAQPTFACQPFGSAIVTPNSLPACIVPYSLPELMLEVFAITSIVLPPAPPVF